MFSVPFKDEKTGKKISIIFNSYNINYNTFINRINEVIKRNFFNKYVILSCDKVEIYPRNYLGDNFLNKDSAFYVELNRDNSINDNISTCPICYESNNLISPFRCSHFICSNCNFQLIQRDIHICSLCRSN